MTEILPFSVVMILGGFALAALRDRFTSAERRILATAFAAHVLAAVAQVVLTRDVLGGGDMFAYHLYGNMFADLIVRDPVLYFPRVLRLVFLDPQPDLPFDVLGAGAATGAMFGISALLHLLCAGSLYATCLLLSMGSLFGTIGLYLAVRPSIAPRQAPQILGACVLMPSVIYWSSGLLKESVAFVGFGWCVLGIRWLVHGRWFRGSVLFLVAVTPAALVKPYILFVLALGAGIWWYWERTIRKAPDGAVTIRPGYLVVGVAIALAGVIALGRVFPDYAVDVLADGIADQQEVGARTTGGSNYGLTESSSRSLSGQLLLAPLALLTSLFRPLIFEARTALQFVNALETGWLTVITVQLLATQRARLIGRIRRSPMIAFALAFVVVFGTLVGLATTNLGTLSRYRLPLTPLFAVVLLLLRGAPRVVRTLSARLPNAPSARAT